MLCLCLHFSIADIADKISKLTHLESVEAGWWYAARIPGKLLLLAFYTDAETVKKLNLKQKDQFLNLLSQSPQSSKLAKDLEIMDEGLIGFPAASYRLNAVAGKNWLAIGDAATAYDPITSQCIMKAMMNGIMAAETIINNEAQTGFHDYANRLETDYHNYLDRRRQFYNMEMRWPASSFWKKYQK